MKQFAKQIGAPDATIEDTFREDVSQEVNYFCNCIGTALRVLNEGTIWATMVELYVVLLKEVVTKDMK